MARTVSVAAPDPNRTDDLDGRLVDGIEALRQRLVQAIRFRYRTWYLARERGLDYELLIGHQITPDLAASTLNGVIREEGAEEVLGLRDIHFELDRPNRVFSYRVMVDTIYGELLIEAGG